MRTPREHITYFEMNSIKEMSVNLQHPKSGVLLRNQSKQRRVQQVSPFKTIHYLLDRYRVVRNAQVASAIICTQCEHALCIRREHATNGRAIGSRSTGCWRQIHSQLTNNADQRMIFKFLSTNNDEYRVRPVFGFVDPASNASIEATRPNGPPKDDRIVVQFAPAPRNAIEAREAFGQTEVTSMFYIISVPPKSRSINNMWCAQYYVPAKLYFPESINTRNKYQ
ncbi:hypothetical protein GCK32_005473 [Trichostrongylus colubriformis]|uniref:Major sperm protein n=1 Tax=Trichostrongylus colubriformis TaxID=6319 RepID=A0AAN8ITS4_TRICO